MAINRPSDAPMFRELPRWEAELTEDTGVDLILHKRGANQFLGADASHHDGQSTLGPRGNQVQDGALSLINSTSPLGTPDKANPAGRQTS